MCLTHIGGFLSYVAIIKRNSGLSSAAHFAEQKILNCFLLLQNTKSGGGESDGAAEGGCGGNSATPELQNSSFGFVSKKVRTSSKNDRQFVNSPIWEDVASRLRRPALYFAAIFQAFLKSKESVRSAMRKFAVRSTGKTKVLQPIFKQSDIF